MNKNACKMPKVTESATNEFLLAGQERQGPIRLKTVVIRRAFSVNGNYMFPKIMKLQVKMCKL